MNLFALKESWPAEVEIAWRRSYFVMENLTAKMNLMKMPAVSKKIKNTLVNLLDSTTNNLVKLSNDKKLKQSFLTF